MVVRSPRQPTLPCEAHFLLSVTAQVFEDLQSIANSGAKLLMAIVILFARLTTWRFPSDMLKPIPSQSRHDPPLRPDCFEVKFAANGEDCMKTRTWRELTCCGRHGARRSLKLGFRTLNQLRLHVKLRAHDIFPCSAFPFATLGLQHSASGHSVFERMTDGVPTAQPDDKILRHVLGPRTKAVEYASPPFLATS